MKRILTSWPWLIAWTAFLTLMTGINLIAAIGHMALMPAHPLSESLYATNNIACGVVMIACTAQMRGIITRKGRHR